MRPATIAPRRPPRRAAILAGVLITGALAGPAATAPAQEANREADQSRAQETGEPADAEPAAVVRSLPGVLDPGAPDGAELTARTVRPLDRYDLPVGRYSRGEANARTLEGRVIRTAWRLADEDATTAAVMAGYAERIAALGYETIFRCATEACGGFDFRFAVELMAPPAMLVDAADFAQLSARRRGAEGDTFLSILVSRLLGAVYIQTVAVGQAPPPIPITPMPDDAAATPAPAPTPGQTPDQTPGQPPGQASDAEDMVGRLVAQGHLPLRGVDFETGSARITDASAAILDRAARALAARPGLALLVVGHSDNRGGLDDNIALSRRRAEAVRAALVERGVAADRLEARGVGFLAPVAANDSEQGRARNRRVELVLR